MTLIIGAQIKQLECASNPPCNIPAACLAFDLCAAITGIVIYTLAVYGYLDIPHPGPYIAIGLGCGLLALDIAFALYNALRQCYKHNEFISGLTADQLKELPPGLR